LAPSAAFTNAQTIPRISRGDDRMETGSFTCSIVAYLLLLAHRQDKISVSRRIILLLNHRPARSL